MFCIFSAAFVHVLACESIDIAADAYCCSVRPKPLHAKLSNLLLGIALLELGGMRTKSDMASNLCPVHFWCDPTDN